MCACFSMSAVSCTHSREVRRTGMAMITALRERGSERAGEQGREGAAGGGVPSAVSCVESR